MFEISSISDYINLLKDFHSKIDYKDGFPEYEYYYRGEPQDFKETSGTPNIGRGNRLLHETEIFRECERRLPREFAKCRSTFEKLVLMQHYRVPTRLLDVSFDPLQALFFALFHDVRSQGETDDCDAIVLLYKIKKDQIKDYHSDAVSVVSNIALYPLSKGFLDIKDLPYDPKHSDVFNENWEIKYLHHEIQAEKPYFKECINKADMESVFCVHPLLDNPRIKSQQGAFLLFGINGSKKNLATLQTSKNTHIEMCKILIPKIFKNNIREELYVLNRGVDSVYPDWDGVGDYFARFWNKRPREYYK